MRPALLACLFFVAACDDGTGPGACAEPGILTSAVAGNPRNVLAASLDLRVANVDSVAVAYRALEDAAESSTPAARAISDSLSVPILGLRPRTAYEFRGLAFGGCGKTISSPALTLQTGALPADLPSFSAAGSDPSPGFVVFAARGYGVAIDNSGRVVWYHPFDLDPGLNFQPQPNGRYVARPPSQHPGAPWIEIDTSGRRTRALYCALGLTARFHDMLALPDGSYWLLCDETRILDLSALGGLRDARVTGTAVQHLGPAGEVLFHWSPFDHISIDVLSAADRAAAQINWTHGNALELDHDGNLLLSFRNLSQVVKVEVPSGRVLWRLGGRGGDFVFENGHEPLFTQQHGVRTAGPDRILLLDNLGEAGGTRAERYEVDAATRRVRLIGTYASEPGVIAQVGGTTQSLAGGGLLVSFGSGGRVEEYDASGKVVWRIEGSPGYVFRAQRIVSLHDPGWTPSRPGALTGGSSSRR